MYFRILWPSSVTPVSSLDINLYCLKNCPNTMTLNLSLKHHSKGCVSLCFQSEVHLLQRLNSLNTAETRALLSRYFDKVVGLRDQERKLNLKNSEMEVRNSCSSCH